MNTIEIKDSVDADAWNSYVTKKKLNHHAFRYEWSNIFKKTFGHQAKYLGAFSREGELCGIAPLFIFKSKLFGKSLISVPYLNAGGIVADSEEAHRKLANEAAKLAKELGAKYVELRHQDKSSYFEDTTPCRSHKVTMELSLPSDPDELFKAFKPKLRSQIRRPGKAGCSVESSHCSEQAVSDFYAVFAENMRDLGTPVYPKSLFSATAKSFGKSARIFVVKKDGAPAAAGLTVGEGDSVEILWASSIRRYNKDSPNMMLYWEAIKQACLDGYSTFDFGRSSPDAGTFRFKKQWGSVPRTLHWYYLMDGGELPDVNPNNPKFKLMVNCWQKLPLSVANLLGPMLSKQLP